MRLRNIPHAEGVIQMHRTVIKRPEDQRGCWHQVFGDRASYLYRNRNG